MKPLVNRNFADQPHILIVDDDDRIRTLVSRYLHENGFVVATAENAAQAREVMRRLAFDALVVDVMMPGQSGLEFTKELRAGNAAVPVLLLTALGEAGDRISGLESGADDYLPKPFEPRELVLRLQAILRRRQTTAKKTALRLGRWLYDPEQNELRDGDMAERLTAAEGTLLQALAARAGETIGREELAVLCGVDASGRTIDVQVTRLRRKLEDNPKAPRCLQTMRGKGYRLLAELV